jgi:hypothetical protein
MSLIEILIYWYAHTAISCHLLKLVPLCPHCTMSPVETGTFVSTLHSVACCDWYCHIHKATSCHLLRLVALCPLCAMSAVETGTFTSILHSVVCWDWYCHVHMATSCHLLRLVLLHLLHSVVCWDWYCHIHKATSCHLLRLVALCPLCAMSAVETGTFTSILHSVVCWDWYCHVHMATSCHLLRLVSCPYCNILPSPVQIDTITSTVQVECTAQSNHILTAVLQSITSTVAWELNAWCEVQQTGI